MLVIRKMRHDHPHRSVLLLISVGGFWAAFVAYVAAVADSRVDVARLVAAVAAVVVEDNLVVVVEQLFNKLTHLIYLDRSDRAQSRAGEGLKDNNEAHQDGATRAQSQPEEGQKDHDKAHLSGRVESGRRWTVYTV